MIVVFPVRAISTNQVPKLNAALNSARAVVIDCENPMDSTKRSEINAGMYTHIYVTVEQLLDNTQLQTVITAKAIKQRLVSVWFDEAHTVYSWREIKWIYDRFPNLRSKLAAVPVGLSTATADEEVITNVNKTLAMKHPDTDLSYTIRRLQDRPNIMYKAICLPKIPPFFELLTERNAPYPLVEILNKLRDAIRLKKPQLLPRTLIYVADTDGVSRIWQFFANGITQGVPVIRDASQFVAGYMGSISEREKGRVHLYMTVVGSPMRIVVSTSGLGLGVDFWFRHVIHYRLPPDIRELYQQGGRGGRKRGERAFHTVIYQKTDFKEKKSPLRTWLEGDGTAGFCRRMCGLKFFESKSEREVKKQIQVESFDFPLPEKCCDVCSLRQKALVVQQGIESELAAVSRDIYELKTSLSMNSNQ